MCVDRRRILRVGGCALLGSAAGCTTPDGGSGSGTTTADPAAPLGATREVDGGLIAVESVAVWDSFVFRRAPGVPGFRDAAGGRFLVAVVGGGRDRPAPGAFELVTDAGRFEAGVDFGRGLLGSDLRPWTGFRVPAPFRVDRARIAVDGAAWRVPDRHLERIRHPKPTFELRSFSVPGRVRAGGAFEVGATFRNASDRTGTLRAVLDVSGIPVDGRWIARRIPPGQREPWRERIDVDDHPAVSEVSVRLAWPGGTRAATVTATDDLGEDGHRPPER